MRSTKIYFGDQLSCLNGGYFEIRNMHTGLLNKTITGLYTLQENPISVITDMIS